ncbi:hypothetical protein FRC06_008425, partial [Ceratobasidium sp. 370]
MEVDEDPPVRPPQGVKKLHAALAAGDFDSNNNSNPPHNNNDGGIGDVHMEVDKGADPEGDTFAKFAPGVDNGPPPPLLKPVPVHEMRRNPPVLTNDWPDPGSEHKSEPEDPIEGPANGPDQHPLYELGKANSNPLNEHEIPDAVLQAHMVRELGELAEVEWEEL